VARLPEEPCLPLVLPGQVAVAQALAGAVGGAAGGASGVMIVAAGAAAAAVLLLLLLLLLLCTCAVLERCLRCGFVAQHLPRPASG
jgi:hypothetical protein